MRSATSTASRKRSVLVLLLGIALASVGIPGSASETTNTDPGAWIYGPDFVAQGKPATFHSLGHDEEDARADLVHTWDFGDGTNATGATVQHAWSVPGAFTVTLTVTDTDGGDGTTSKVVRVDGTAPSSTVTVTGKGTNGVYTGPVDLTFDAWDEPAPPSSGISHLVVSPDGTKTERHEPGTVLRVHADGVHTVTYRAVDKAGNLEDIQSTTFPIDTTPPMVTITAPESEQTGPLETAPSVSGNVVIEGTSEDATSGVVELRLYVDKALKRIQGATDGPYTLEWDASGYFYGYHDLRVEAIDLAGYRSSTTVRVFHAP